MSYSKQDQTRSNIHHTMIPQGESIIVEECIVDNKYSTTGSGPKRRKHYRQLYRQQWEKDPAFAGWLKGVNKDMRKAMCVACKSMMVAEITVIKNHAKGKRHLRNLEKFENKVGILNIDSHHHVQSQNEDLDLEFYEYDDEYMVLHQDSDSDPDRSHFKKKVKTEKNATPWTSNTRGMYHPSGTINMHDSQIIPIVPDDENDIFGKHVACELRQLDDALTKQNTKIKISTILYEARVSLLNKSQNQRDSASHNNNMQNYIVLDQTSSGTVTQGVE